MNQKTRKQTIHWLKVAVIGIALGFALQFVRAWTEPTTTPPGGNVGAPINTSGNAQTKAGNFTSNGIISAGDQFCLRGVCISAWPSGTTTDPAPAPAPAPCLCNTDPFGGGSVYGATVLPDATALTHGLWVCLLVVLKTGLRVLNSCSLKHLMLDPD